MWDSKYNARWRSCNGAATPPGKLFVALILVAVANGSQARAEWDTYQGDASHDGYVAIALPNAQPKLLWSQTLALGELTGMAIGGGNVYVASDGGSNQANVFALNTATGAISWEVATGDNFSENAPAYSNGSVYVHTNNNVLGTYLWSFNSSSGATLFKATVNGQWEHYLAPTVYSGNVYMEGGEYGGMYSMSATNGAQNWSAGVPQYDTWTPAVNANYCYAYTGSGDDSPITGVFTIVNRLTGALVSTTTDSGYVYNGYTMNEAPALGTSNDAFVTNGGRLLKFGTTAAGGLLSVQKDNFSGQPTVAAGVVYVDDGSALVALSEASGTRLWSWTPQDGDSLLGQSIATENMLFTSTSNDVYCVNIPTGQTEWSVAASGKLALSDDVLYVSNYNGVVTAIAVPEPATGFLLAIGAAICLHRPRRVG